MLHGLDAAVAAATAGLGRPRRAVVRLLVGRRRAAAGRGRLRAAGHRRGRPPGRAVGRRPGRARGGRAAGRRRAARRCARPGPTWCCWSAAPTAATPRCCCTTRPGWPRPGWRRAGGGGRQRRRPRRGRGRAGRPAACRSRRPATCCPRIGVLDPGPARAAIREVFLRHVIGGKRLSRGPRFASLVRGATPDVVLTGGGAARRPRRRRPARGRRRRRHHRRVLGAAPDPERAGRPREVAGDAVARPAPSRATSGCGGARPAWSPRPAAERLLARRRRTLAARPRRRAADPALAGRRRGPAAGRARRDGRGAPARPRRRRRGRGRRDLRDVRLRGRLRRGAAARRAGRAPRRCWRAVLADHAGGWALPRAAATVVDRDYVLAAAGLLAADHPAAALALLRGHLLARGGMPGGSRRGITDTPRPTRRRHEIELGEPVDTPPGRRVPSVSPTTGSGCCSLRPFVRWPSGRSSDRPRPGPGGGGRRGGANRPRSSGVRAGGYARPVDNGVAGAASPSPGRSEGRRESDLPHRPGRAWERGAWPSRPRPDSVSRVPCPALVEAR